MKARRKSAGGMTLVEMLAAITVLMILTAILAQVFYQATQASAKGKGLAEIYQVARALKQMMARDLSGATPDAFISEENGLTVRPVYGLPPGPYNLAQHGTTLGDPVMRRMLMGGSDYIVFTSANAGARDRTVAKVFYVLRASGEFIRVVHADSAFSGMDYRGDAAERGFSSTYPTPPGIRYIGEYEQAHVIAENVTRVKFSFLDRGGGPVSETAGKSVQGVWVDAWNWEDSVTPGKKYLPAAVKVELQIVDHLWKITDDDGVSNRNFDPVRMNLGAPEASEMFDPDDGEAFTFILDIPLGMKGPGG